MATEKNATGLIDAPLPLGSVNLEPYIDFISGGEELPLNFIVPAFQHWFTDDWQPIPENINTLKTGEEAERNQSWLDRCVGEGFAVAKSSHEGVWISAKDVWAITKRLEAANGRPRSAYGAYAHSGAEAIKRGAASEKLVPSKVAGLTREQHMDESWVDENVEKEREQYAGERTHYVTRDRFKRTLFETKHPFATHCGWFTGDNDIGRNGRPPTMGTPEGKSVGGHMFALIGWIQYEGRECYVTVNSWGKNWGWYGLFLIPIQDISNRLGNGYIHIDKDEADLAELLARYNGKNLHLLGTPDYYRCELGVLRKYPDEIVWWAHGNTFGFNVYDLPEEDFERIPKGADMRIEDGPHAELVRQIRQQYGQL